VCTTGQTRAGDVRMLEDVDVNPRIFQRTLVPIMMRSLVAVALALTIAGAGAGCTKRVDLEKVPVGTDIQVTRQDGGVVSGTLAARDDLTVTVKSGSTSRSVPRAQIAQVQLVDETQPVVLPAIATFREFTLPAGTAFIVRLDSAVGSGSSRVNDPIEATLTNAVVVDGTNVIPVGSIVRGEVSSVQSSGKVKGRGSLSLFFSSVSVAGHAEPYPIAARISRVAPGSKSEEAATIAIPAAGGAIIGALLGGKKGALVGTAIGGGGGTAVVLSTRGPQVELPRGSGLSLRLDHAIDVRVPIRKS
jgi:hypothetical protein